MNEEEIIEEVVGLIERAGFNAVVGHDAIVEKIIDLAPKEGSMIKYCSGYGVFPDGEKCPGCPDCK